jgi:hypothetical protein
MLVSDMLLSCFVELLLDGQLGNVQRGSKKQLVLWPKFGGLRC